MARRWDASTTVTANDALPTEAAAVTLRHTYDGGDMRTVKEATSCASGALSGLCAPVTTHSVYVFDSLDLRRAYFTAATGEADYEATAETEAAYLVANGVRLARLHHEPTLPVVDGDGLHVLLELADHLGSGAIVLDKATSELAERMTYQGYGSVESDYRPGRWGAFREDYRFTGKEEDSEVGLTYFGMRYLNTALGRWASADPLTVHGAGADLNAYAYVHGRVLSATDPVGLADESANESTPQPNQTNTNGCGAAKSCEGTPEPAEGAPDFDKMDLSSLQGSGPPIGSPEHIQQLQKGGNQASIERKMAEAKKMMAPPAPIPPKWHVPNASAGAAHETLQMAGQSKNGLEKTIGYSLGAFLTGASLLNGLVVDAVNFPADVYASYKNHENGNDVEAITSGMKGLLGAAAVLPGGGIAAQVGGARAVRNSLRALGMTKVEQQAFLRGEAVVYHLTDGKTLAVAEYSNGRLTSGIFSINTATSGVPTTMAEKYAAGRIFLDFQNKSLSLARSMKLQQMDFAGVAFRNPELRASFLKRGFTPAMEQVPASLGGGEVETLRKTVNVK